MTRPRSVTLAEKRAEVRALTDQAKAHRLDCNACEPRGRCPDRVALDERLRDARHEVKHWFDPGENDVRLF